MARHVEGAWFRSGRDAWYATVEGKSIPLGIKGKENRALAVDAWHKLMANGNLTTTHSASRASNTKPPEPDADAGGLTVRELVDAFLADARGRLKASTVRIYGYDLDSLCGSLGKLKANSITAKQIENWLHTLKISSTTKAMTLRSVSACFGWGERNDVLTANVVKRVPKPKSRSRSADAVISEADHAKLMEAADPDFKTVLMVLHGTGCRPGVGGAVGFYWAVTA